MTYIVSGGALNSTVLLTHSRVNGLLKKRKLTYFPAYCTCTGTFSIYLMIALSAASRKRSGCLFVCLSRAPWPLWLWRASAFSLGRDLVAVKSKRLHADVVAASSDGDRMRRY